MFAPKTVNSTGFIVLHNPPSYPLRGIGEAPPTLIQSLPKGSLIARGIGDTPVTGFNNAAGFGQPAVFGTAAGSMQLNILTPASGNVSVAFLVDNDVTPKAYLGVSLDSQVRPTVTIKSVDGTVVAQTTSSAAAGVTGANLQIILSWNAMVGYASVSVNGVVSPSTDWTISPTGKPWTPWSPVALQLGLGNISGLAAFPTTGTIQCVQVAP